MSSLGTACGDCTVCYPVQADSIFVQLLFFKEEEEEEF